MSANALNSAHDTETYPHVPASTPTPRRGLSRPLAELIETPDDEALLTIARILGLANAVQRRLDREAAERKAAGEAA